MVTEPTDRFGNRLPPTPDWVYENEDEEVEAYRDDVFSDLGADQRADTIEAAKIKLVDGFDELSYICFCLSEDEDDDDALSEADKASALRIYEKVRDLAFATEAILEDAEDLLLNLKIAEADRIAEEYRLQWRQAVREAWLQSREYELEVLRGDLSWA